MTGAKSVTHSRPVPGARAAFGGKALTRRTQLILSDDMDVEGWRGIGRQMFIISDSSRWWLGDWLIFGQRRFPDRYRTAVDETGLDYQMLRNYAWTAGRFDPARRRATLSFQHHAEVAALPESQRDAWLDDAERYAWSRNMLRSRIRTSRHLATPDRQAEPVRVTVEIPPDRLMLWQRAADNAQRELLDWMAEALDAAAQRAAAISAT